VVLRAAADEDGDRFVEIWNNVFMQNEQLRRWAAACRWRSRQSIPAWGWNASAAILQGKHDNYDIDLLRVD
jgi:alanyl-tRNA synthetase